MTRQATSGQVSPILVLLALGFAFRLIIAYRLPGSGFGTDLATFHAWANDLAAHGPFGFYDRPFFHDYTPGYLYALWAIGLVERVLPTLDLIKIPAIVADVAGAWLIWSMALEIGAARRAALAAAALYLFVPITWFDSVVWGQVDSVGVVFLLLGVRALWRDKPEQATMWAVIAAVIKPQLAILVPIAAAVILRRYLWDAFVQRDAGRDPDQDAAADGSWLRNPRGPVRILTTAVTGVVTASALTLPFGIWIPGLIGQVQVAFGGYPYVSVNAFNPWALVTQGANGLAANGLWLCDAVTSATIKDTPCPPGTEALIGPFPAVAVGSALLILSALVVTAVVARRPDPRSILVATAVLAIVFFVVPTRVHERYLFPFFALGAVLASLSRRWVVAYAVLAIANFLNMYAVLTMPRFKNPHIRDWLGITPGVTSTLGVTIIATMHAAAFAWAAWQLRGSASRQLAAAGATTAAMASSAMAPPALAAQSLARALPGRGIEEPVEPPPVPWTERYPELGALAPLTRRLFMRPLRADRSRALDREATGRLDRLDLWILIVLVVAALGLRTWRLSEPFSMHFDEVYHARTATEFLQDWRYGEPHAIYEYTHPHLAKYVMAAGIMAWGNDRVTATSSLGVPVRDAIVEKRWDDPVMPDHRAGDRLYAATGTEVRVYDLATREELASVPLAGVTALAIDDSTHRLFAATDTGRVAMLDAAAELDTLRLGGSAAALTGFSDFASVGAPIRKLYATSDGSFVLAITTDEVVSIDAGSGEILARARLSGAAEIASAGTSDTLVADPSAVTNATDEAATLAELIGGEPKSYEKRLAGDANQVVLAGSLDQDIRTDVETAIADGRLVGISFEALPNVAVAGAEGVSIVSPADMSVTNKVPIAGGATGLALTSDLDAPRLYVAGGRAVTVIKLASNASTPTPPTVEFTIPMPGPVSRVTFDPASVMVHVLGTAPSGTGSTIYVIEPHAQAVYTDAPLPFAPAAWVTDADNQMPSEDRQQIVALAADGSAASVDIGHHAFAWRMPGVIAGALTAGLLFLLARILFRRRSIGVLVGILSLADGMLFVQSRIAMNDVYVGLFIVAAYVLFAALWTGVWRGWAAFWLGMPAIGVLLGLALASKWVAAYAIAAMALLILVRSALGRVLVILGLIAGTALLGYQAIVVNHAADGTATSGGNVSFLLIMIGLTIVATVVTVVHPIAWSPEEVRLAIGAPALAGIAIGLVAIPLAGGTATVKLGPLQGSGTTMALTVAILLLLLAAAVAAVFAVAGRLGFGPDAPPLAPDDPARFAEPAAPPPDGWLRPGAALGLPVAWAGACLLLLPVALYIIAYIPWALNSGGPAGSPQIFPTGTPLIGNWPPGHNGQTLLALTTSMYDYHNNLRAAHAASSPWWAWPFDFKPVWFYQGSFANGTSGAIYDAGNIAIWWLGVPAMAFLGWQAFKRRSLGLALVGVAFAFQWLSWSRIDRATFQYHYYTSVPFIVLALAYLLAELWHGPSRRTWLLARVSAAVAVMGPGLLWLSKTPLCAFVDVNRAYANSPACTGNPGDLVVTARTLGLLVVVGIGLAALLYQLVNLDARGRRAGGPPPPSGGLPEGSVDILKLVLTAVLVAGAAIVVSFLSDEPLINVRGFQIAPVAIGAVVVLGFVAWFIVSARDARRFVAGAILAVVGTFVVFYPNIAALPLPSAVFNAYQGLLPTYLYPFQFPVNTDEAPRIPGLFEGDPQMGGLPGVPTLVIALAITCLVVAYAAWSWRMAMAEGEAYEAGESGPLQAPR